MFLYPQTFSDWAIPRLVTFINEYFQLVGFDLYFDEKERSSIKEAFRGFQEEYENHLKIQMFL
jgi:hypothetical protein